MPWLLSKLTPLESLPPLWLFWACSAPACSFDALRWFTWWSNWSYLISSSSSRGSIGWDPTGYLDTANGPGLPLRRFCCLVYMAFSFNYFCFCWIGTMMSDMPLSLFLDFIDSASSSSGLWRSKLPIDFWATGSLAIRLSGLDAGWGIKTEALLFYVFFSTSCLSKNAVAILLRFGSNKFLPLSSPAMDPLLLSHFGSPISLLAPRAIKLDLLLSWWFISF